MDPEEDPFETSSEKGFNKLLDEMAKQKQECEAKIEELQRVISQKPSGVEGSSPSSGDGDHHLGGGTNEGSGGSSSWSADKVSGHNHSSTVGDVKSDPTSTNKTEVPHQSNPVPHFNGTGWFDRSPGDNSTAGPVYRGNDVGNITSSFNNGTVPAGGGCPPCPILPEVCGPSGRDSSSVLVTLEAVLVGAAATFLLLVLAAAVAIVIRYLEIFTSGLLIIAIIVLVWYCSSMYPDAARRLGTRAWEALRDTARSIVDRLLRRSNSEVSVS
jgi:hypothetical protein